MYQWLAKFRHGGMAALEEKPVPGRPTKLRPAQLQRLYQLVVGKNPLQLRFALRPVDASDDPRTDLARLAGQSQRERGGAVAAAHVNVVM
jgi:transposase